MKKSMMIAIAAAMLTAGATNCHAQTSQSQQTEQKQDSVYAQDKVEQPAEFPGGQKKMMEFVWKNMKYPTEAMGDNASGIVRVHFIVEKDSTLTDVKVPESVHPALDAEGIRIVKAMPKWTPAKVKGKAVRSKFCIPLTFRLG